MSNYEYHQFLKFLYFEGYADSYEEAEYLLEELNDEELENLIEQSGITDTNRRTRDRLIRQYGPEFLTNPRPTGKKRKVTSVKSIELTNQEPKKRRTTDMSKVIVAHYLFGEGYAETLEGAEVMAENISEDWTHLILSEKPFQIYGPDPHGSSDSESRPLGKPYKNKKRAKTRADKLDQEIGGYRHSVRKVDEEYKDLTPEKEEKVKNRVGELARDIQVQSGQMKDLNKKPFGKYRPKVKQEKEAILKSARKKQKLVQNASDALIRTSTSRSASIQKRIQDLKDRS